MSGCFSLKLSRLKYHEDPVMRPLLAGLLLSALMVPTHPRSAAAYDMDCAIILCMAGGFPPSDVCAAAYATMIRRITPWPVRPPFGICSYTAMPVAGSPAAVEVLDTMSPDYAWLRRTRVIWFDGYGGRDDDGDWDWRWHVRSCEHALGQCRRLLRVRASPRRWSGTVETENGLVVDLPDPASGRHRVRAVMIEYGDHQGLISRSEWFRY